MFAPHPHGLLALWEHWADEERDELEREERAECAYLESLEESMGCIRCGKPEPEELHCDDCAAELDWERREEMACADLDAFETAPELEDEDG